MRPLETGAIVLLWPLFFPVSVPVPLLLFAVQRSRVFHPYFNGLSCNLCTPAPCKSPVFYRKGHEREAGPGAVPAAQPDIVTRPDFSLLPLFFALFFSLFPIVLAIVSHCSCAGGFFPVPSRRCIVFRISFPIADRLYLFFPGALRPTRSTRGRRVAASGLRRGEKTQYRQGHRQGTLLRLALFGADPKTVESIPVLKLQDVLVGSSHSVD
jgi:hypothetical protein